MPGGSTLSGGLLSLGDRSARLSVVVGNAGPSPATGITLTLSFAGPFVADSLPEGCLADQLTIVCAVSSLAAEQSIGLPVRVTLGATTPASVEAVVAGSEADPAPQNNRAGPVPLKLQHTTYLPLLSSGPS